MSYCLYIGPNLTKAGHGFLAGYGDEPSSHWLEVIAGKSHQPDSVRLVGVGPDAAMPGKFSEIPEASATLKNIRVSYSHYLGTPAPITNGGLNEAGVAVRTVWSPSRAELVAMTPVDQTGPNYSDLAAMVLERARTAREGAQLIGQLIDLFGHCTYGGNSHLIADVDEAWVCIQFAGGQGLWVAERLGADDIRVSRPGYIDEINIDKEPGNDYICSQNLVSFAENQGWFNGTGSSQFNVNKIYGDGRGPWPAVKWMESEMRQRAQSNRKITLSDVKWALRTHRLTGDAAGYGQVVPLLKTAHNGLRHLWHAQIGAVAAPFTPIYMAAESVPGEFSMHRYLTDGEASRFIEPTRSSEPRPEQFSKVKMSVEATRSATAVYKRLMYLVFSNWQDFLPEVTAYFESIESSARANHASMLNAASALYEQGREGDADRVLSYFMERELIRALDQSEDIARSLECRLRVGTQRPENDEQGLPPKLFW